MDWFRFQCSESSHEYFFDLREYVEDMDQFRLKREHLLHQGERKAYQLIFALEQNLLLIDLIVLSLLLMDRFNKVLDRLHVLIE